MEQRGNNPHWHDQLCNFGGKLVSLVMESKVEVEWTKGTSEVQWDVLHCVYVQMCWEGEKTKFASLAKF